MESHRGLLETLAAVAAQLESLRGRVPSELVEAFRRLRVPSTLEELEVVASEFVAGVRRIDPVWVERATTVLEELLRWATHAGRGRDEELSDAARILLEAVEQALRAVTTAAQDGALQAGLARWIGQGAETLSQALTEHALAGFSAASGRARRPTR